MVSGKPDPVKEFDASTSIMDEVEVKRLLNHVYYESGFQGRVAPHAFPNGHKVNALTIFRPEKFESNYKGKVVMELGKGSSLKNAVPVGKGLELGNTRVFYNGKLFSNVEHGGFSKFDPTIPKNKEFADSFKAADAAEAERLASHKSDIDYNEAAMTELAQPKITEADIHHTKLDAESLLDELGVTELELEELNLGKEFESSVKNLKSADKIKQAQKAFHSCALKSKGL
jgi:hypothetical protein